METSKRSLDLRVNWRLRGANSELAKLVAVALMLLYGLLGLAMFT